MAETALAFIAALAALVLLIAWRSRAFHRSGDTADLGDEGLPPVGKEIDLVIRDPRARLDDGDRLDRR